MDIYMVRSGPDRDHLSTQAMPCSSLAAAKRTADNLAGILVDGAGPWEHRGYVTEQTLVRYLPGLDYVINDRAGLLPRRRREDDRPDCYQFIMCEPLDMRADS